MAKSEKNIRNGLPEGDSVSSEAVEEVLMMDPAIRAVQSKLDMIAEDPELLRAYEMAEMARIDYKLALQGAREKGREEGLRKGRKKGRQEGKRETAKLLKSIKTPVEQIIFVTGLSPEEIAAL